MRKKIIGFCAVIMLMGSVFGQTCSIQLGNDTTLCQGGTLPLSIATQLTLFDDSLRIVYDATQGQTGLVGASKVYMHSGAEITPFAGWQYPVGNWGMDDGIGQMDSIGPNLWEITLHPQSYYGYPSGSTLNGIFMVFRSADGSATGKDGSGGDIFLYTVPTPPTCSFGGVTGTWKTDAVSSILWSDGATTASTTANAPGAWWVQVTDTAGCVATDTLQLTIGGSATIDLGPNQTLCAGNTLTLDAGAGFSSYLWSNGATSQVVQITAGGNYSIEVTDTFGCQGLDLIFIDEVDVPVADFQYSVSGNTATFTDISVDGRSWEWDFDNDGLSDDTTQHPTHNFGAVGSYPVRLITENPCGKDTIIQTVNTGVVGIEDGANQIARIYPNPVNENLFISPKIPLKNAIISLTDLSGKLHSQQKITETAHELKIPTGTLPAGTYLLLINHAGGTYSHLLIKS